MAGAEAEVREFAQVKRLCSSVVRSALIALLLSRFATAEQPDNCAASFSFVANAPSAGKISGTVLDKNDLRLSEDSVPQEIRSLRGPSGDGLVILLLDAASFFPQTGHSGSLPNALTQPLVRAVSRALTGLQPKVPLVIYTSYYELRSVRDFLLSGTGKLSFPSLTPEMIRTASLVFQQRILQRTQKTQIHIVSAEIYQWEMLESIANHVASVPGRKVLIWLGGDNTTYRIPPPEGQLYYAWFAAVAAAERAQLSVYSLPTINANSNLKTLCAMTGGRSYSDAKYVSSAIQNAFQDVRSNYELCWNPTGSKTQPMHSIRLESAYSAMRLLYERMQVDPILPRNEELRLKAAEAALATPLSAEAIRISATIKSKAQGTTAVTVQFDGKSLVLNSSRSQGDLLDVLFVYYDAGQNRLAGGRHDTVELNIDPKRQREFRNKTHTLTQVLSPPPAAATLRIVLRDGNSGKVGSTSIQLR